MLFVEERAGSEVIFLLEVGVTKAGILFYVDTRFFDQCLGSVAVRNGRRDAAADEGCPW
jgi:hypothetical protein